MNTEQQTTAPPPAAFLPTLAAAALLMTFLQFITAWIENIYRMSLIKLEMGPEIAGLLIPLAVPLLVWLVGRAPGLLLRLAVLTYLALYALVWWPPTGPVATILYAGTGVALALTIAAYGLNDTRAVKVDGFGVSMLATVALASSRMGWHSLDSYAAGSKWSLLPILVLLPLLALSGNRDSAAPQSRGVIPAAIGLFGITTLIYLYFSAPGVMTSWESTSSATAGYYQLAVLFAAATIAVFGTRERAKTHFALAVIPGIWLTVSFWLERVDFPAGPSSTLTVAGGASGQMHLLVLSSLLSFIFLAVSFGTCLRLLRGRAPFPLSLLLTIGIYLLVLITMMLIFTNVWGYVGPLSHALRNLYALPFAITMLAVIASLFLLRGELTDEPKLDRGIIFLTLLLLIYFPDHPAPSPSVPLRTGNTFTLLTYNIQQGSREDGDQAYMAQCEFIRKVNPDLVALQESDTARPSGGFVDTAAFFGGRLGYHTYYGPSTIAGTFGTAILSRYPIEDARTIYTYSDADEVGTALIELKINGKEVRLYNNHPAGSDTVMNAHADMLVKEIAQGGPVIATGDFNSRPNEAPYKAIAAVLHDAWATLHPNAKGPGFTFEPGQVPGEIDMTRRIDHIFFSDDFEVLEAHYVLPPESQTDHPAHWARLRMR